MRDAVPAFCRMSRSPRWSAKLVVTAMLAAALTLVVKTPPAAAHASDFETLTVDLLLTTGGLVAIEGAFSPSPGPDFEPYPTDETRETIAVAVMHTLWIEVADSGVKSGDSRYHEPGFSVRPPVPVASEKNGTLRLDTSALQRIAADRNLKLSPGARSPCLPRTTS